MSFGGFDTQFFNNGPRFQYSAINDLLRYLNEPSRMFQERRGYHIQGEHTERWGSDSLRLHPEDPELLQQEVMCQTYACRKWKKICVIMKRPFPREEDRVDGVSVTESDSTAPNSNNNGILPNPANQFPLPNPASDIDVLIKRAAMYQEYMKQIPIPSSRGSVIPFTSWMGLGKSIKALYGQPLHYLTNILLKKWDQLRIGSADEYTPLDDIIHPSKAEASVWLMEEIHRQTSSHFHIADLWKDDPMHSGFIDSIFPTLENKS